MCTFKRWAGGVALVGALVVSALWAVAAPATAATTPPSRVTVTPAVVGRGGLVIISGSVSPVTCPVPGGGAPGVDPHLGQRPVPARWLRTRSATERQRRVLDPLHPADHGNAGHLYRWIAVWGRSRRGLRQSPGDVPAGQRSDRAGQLAVADERVLPHLAGQIGNDYWTPSRGWTSQTLPGPADAASAPSALANSPSLMNVFFTTSAGQIGNDYWTPSRGWTSQTLARARRRRQRPERPGELAVADERVLHHLRRPDRQRLLDPVSGLGQPDACRARRMVAVAPSALANSPSQMNVFTASSQPLVNDYWTPSGGWINQSFPVPSTRPAPRPRWPTHRR